MNIEARTALWRDVWASRTSIMVDTKCVFALRSCEVTTLILQTTIATFFWIRCTIRIATLVRIQTCLNTRESGCNKSCVRTMMGGNASIRAWWTAWFCGTIRESVTFIVQNMAVCSWTGGKERAVLTSSVTARTLLILLWTGTVTITSEFC